MATKKINDRNYPVDCTCPMCGEATAIKVRMEDFEKRLFERKPVQECYPYLSRPERESIISGYCFECQKKLFPANYDNKGNYIA